MAGKNIRSCPEPNFQLDIAEITEKDILVPIFDFDQHQDSTKPLSNYFQKKMEKMHLSLSYTGNICFRMEAIIQKIKWQRKESVEEFFGFLKACLLQINESIKKFFNVWTKNIQIAELEIGNKCKLPLEGNCRHKEFFRRMKMAKEHAFFTLKDDPEVFPEFLDLVEIFDNQVFLNWNRIKYGIVAEDQFLMKIGEI